MKKTLDCFDPGGSAGCSFCHVICTAKSKPGVKVSQTKTKVNGERESKATPVQQIADFGSRIGFKGHEHLGNNLNAIWQVETNVNVAGCRRRLLGWS